MTGPLLGSNCEYSEALIMTQGFAKVVKGNRRGTPKDVD
jgi:hypothetical protein